MLEETNEFKEFQAKWKWLDKLLKFKKVPNKIPDFKKAVRLTEYTSKKKDENSKEDVQRYEHNIKSQKIKRRFKIKRTIVRKKLFVIFCILILCLSELLTQYVQDWIGTFIDWISMFMPRINIQKLLDIDIIRKSLEIIGKIIKTLLFLSIAECITCGVSKFCPWFMSLSEAIIKFKCLVADCFTISFHRAKTYLNNCRKNVDEVEPYRKGEHIDFVRSDAMKQYISMMNKGPSPLFGESEVYPIAKIGNDSSNENKILENEISKDLSRLEEIYGYHFGVVYKSKFNTMVVDPILTKCPISASCNKKPYFPYERIVPSSGNDGVVMVVKYKDKFLLLKQFRHAIRREQYSFPRVFAEPNSTPEQNAKRELQEEICAVIKKDPILLGRIAPDSGLTSCRAYVFLVEIDDYKAALGHEGIKEIVEVTKPELEEMIELRKIDDGFTLGVHALYKIFKKNECKHKFCDFFKSF